MSGTSLFDDDGAFDDWHRDFTREGKGASSTRPNSGSRRLRKRAFDPLRVDAYWIPNVAGFDAAVTAGQIIVRPPGRQPVRGDKEQGDPRRPKVNLVKRKAEPLRVGSAIW